MKQDEPIADRKHPDVRHSPEQTQQGPWTDRLLTIGFVIYGILVLGYCLHRLIALSAN